MDRSGASALLDAFLFFVIVLVASAAVLGLAASAASEDEAASRGRALEYAEDVRAALLRTTLEDPWHLDRLGRRVDLGQGVTAGRFLADEGALLAGGLAPSCFEAGNRAVLGILGDLLRPPFAGGVRIRFEGGGLWLGRDPPADRVAASWSTFAGGTAVEVGVELWPE